MAFAASYHSVIMIMLPPISTTAWFGFAGITAWSSATSSASSTPNYSSQVTIYNANGAAGLAARTASVLESVGYTNVQAKNYSGTRPQADVVWYSSASEKTTADAVAQKLGISAVVQQNSALQSPVEVILVTD